MTFETTEFQPSNSTPTAVMARLPAIEIVPIVAAYRTSRPAGPEAGVVRSRQVQHSCHRKLWSTARPTAAAVADAYGQPSLRVSHTSATTCTTKPAAPMVRNFEMRRFIKIGRAHV